MATSGLVGPAAVLITGGSGFLGRALVRELQRKGSVLPTRSVRVLDLRPCELPGVEPLVGDVRSLDDLLAACEGIDVVLHAAALVDWGAAPDELLWAVNVNGTENVIEACRSAGVRALVYTSSEDVVYAGAPIVDGDETLPYPDRFPNGYCRTKAQAEALVLEADRGEGVLRTAAIRPCGMWGEGDPYHVGTLLDMARKGPMLRMGDGRARFQNVYVGNVAHAHLLAARALLRGDEAPRGQAYFVTDAPACNFFEFFEPVVRAVGYRVVPQAFSLPRGLMRGLGALAESGAFALRPFRRVAPAVTRFSVDYVCQDVTYRSDKAARELGYAPVHTQEEAMARTVAWAREREGSARRRRGDGRHR